MSEMANELRAAIGWQVGDVPVLIHAAADRIEELEAAIDSAEVSHGYTSNGNLWRFWSKKAQEIAGANGAYRARIKELEAENARLKLALGQIQRRESPEAGKPWSEYGAYGENNGPLPPMKGEG